MTEKVMSVPDMFSSYWRSSCDSHNLLFTHGSCKKTAGDLKSTYSRVKIAAFHIDGNILAPANACVPSFTGPLFKRKCNCAVWEQILAVQSLEILENHQCADEANDRFTPSLRVCLKIWHTP